MSILIKGIDLPTSCENCFAYHSDESGNKGCFITMHIDTRDECQSIQTLCPLIEIPTPHGRLVEEHYAGELQAKQPEGVFIMYRSADKDADRFILEAED